MGNFAADIKRAVDQQPDRAAVRCGEWTQEALSYGELDELGARVAGGLLAHGVRPGERVGLALPAGAVRAVLGYGILRVGAQLVLTGGHHGVRLAFVGAAAAQRADAVAVPVGVGFLGQLAFWPLHQAIEPRGDQDPAVELGGTLTHGALRARAARFPVVLPQRLRAQPGAAGTRSGSVQASIGTVPRR